jgi:hypothetical protein
MNRIISLALFLSLNMATFTVTQAPRHTNVTGRVHVQAHGVSSGPSAAQLSSQNSALRAQVASL